jgi:hypothetical protein
MTTPIRLLFVAGAGRSGTTILNTILGQVPGFVSVGEVRYIWERAFGENHRCGCGEPFADCPFWSDVIARAFGPAGPPAPEPVSRDLLSRLRILHVPAMIARSALGRPTVPPHHNDAAIHAIYRALADTPGVEVIVDSSKLPPYGKLLERLPGVDLRVINVVRDPRANAWSWRRVKQTGDTDKNETMEQLELWRSSLVWSAWNVLIARWFPPSDRSITVRYEDFVARPRETTARIVAMAGGDASALPFVDEHTATLARTHTVAGNPNRHQSGTVALRVDDEWASAMPAAQKWFVTALTFPLIRRLGYRFRV